MSEDYDYGWGDGRADAKAGRASPPDASVSYDYGRGYRDGVADYVEDELASTAMDAPLRQSLGRGSQEVPVRRDPP
jgi:hypothetical protein